MIFFNSRARGIQFITLKQVSIENRSHFGIQICSSCTLNKYKTKNTGILMDVKTAMCLQTPSLGICQSRGTCHCPCRLWLLSWLFTSRNKSPSKENFPSSHIHLVKHPFSPLCHAYRCAFLALHMCTLYFQQFSCLCQRDVIWRRSNQANIDYKSNGGGKVVNRHWSGWIWIWKKNENHRGQPSLFPLEREHSYFF